MSVPDRARQEAYTEIYFLLPDGWLAGIPALNAARERWAVTARAPESPGWSGPRPYVTGEGADALEALEDLGRRLRKLPEVQQRLRQERRRKGGSTAAMVLGGGSEVVRLVSQGLIKLAERRMRAERLRALRARRRRREERRAAEGR